MNCLKYGLMTALLAVLSGACADDYLSLVVIQNQAPDDQCAVTADLESPYLSHGQATVSRGGYFLTPIVQSNLSNLNDDVNGDLVQLRTVSVEIQAVDSDASRAAVAALGDIRGRTRYVSGTVTPGGITSMGFDAIDVEQAAVLSGAIGTASVEVLARVVVEGDVEGTSVKSPMFIYPITVTNGAQIDLGPCDALPAGFIGGGSRGCFHAGQDVGSNVQCCTDLAGDPVCPAQGPAS